MIENNRHRVKYYSKEDLLFSHELTIAENLLENYKQDDKLSLNDLIEFYNIKLYFDNQIFLPKWSLNKNKVYTQKVEEIYKKLIIRILSINDNSLEIELVDLEYNYYENFWSLINNLSVYKNISELKFIELLNKNKNQIYDILNQKQLVNKYDKAIGINSLKLLQTNQLQASGSSGLMSSSGYSVSYSEKKIICIPSKTSKNITEYYINKSVYRDCDLFKYPTKQQVRSKSFTKSESPIIFSNRIAYTIDKSENLMKFENEFYISEVSNFSESEMLASKYDEYCNQKRMTLSKYFKNVSPDKFYIRYSKGTDSWKH